MSLNFVAPHQQIVLARAYFRSFIFNVSEPINDGSFLLFVFIAVKFDFALEVRKRFFVKKASKSGGRWRDLPARYGNWNSIYHKFRLWCSLGLFDRLLKVINADAKDATLLEIDSTFCKVHQSACSALKNQAIGVSRGGKNTKVHVLINDRMQLLNMVLTSGQVHDSEAVGALFKGIKLKGKKFLQIKRTVASKFAFSSLSREQLLVFQTKQISGLSMTLIQNCTSNAILLSGFFSESRITVTLPRASTNWLFALRISFYLLLVLFTFNLPTTPK